MFNLVFMEDINPESPLVSLNLDDLLSHVRNIRREAETNPLKRQHPELEDWAANTVMAEACMLFLPVCVFVCVCS